MYACMNLCILEHEVLYYTVQAHCVNEKTLQSITSFGGKEYSCYFSVSLRKAWNCELRNRSWRENMLKVLLEFL